jgi:hypothetical protein
VAFALNRRNVIAEFIKTFFILSMPDLVHEFKPAMTDNFTILIRVFQAAIHFTFLF